jgi:hypothetical protein
LCGPPPADVFAPIPAEELRAALEEALAWYRQAGDPQEAATAAARALQFLATGRWSSKPAAADWAAGDAAARARSRGLVCGYSR